MDEAQGIRQFWRWWSGHEDALLAALDEGLTPELVEALSERVHAIDERLVWEFGRGRVAKFGLALSGTGDPEARLVAERWRQAGPGDSERIEFHTARQPVPREAVMSPAVQLGEHEQIAFSDFVASVEEDPGRRRIAVGLYHPAFARLPEEAIQQLVFIVLDNTLGEDAVESWLGGIEPLAEPLEDGIDLAALRDRVDALPDRWPPGEASWLMAQGTTEDGHPLMLVLDAGRKRWDHPLLDTWCVVDLPYDASEDGMPASNQAFDAARQLEEEIVATLGDRAAHLGHRTGLGSLSVMLYLAADAVRTVEDWVASRPASVHTEPDPGWRSAPRL